MTEKTFSYSIILPVRNGGHYIQECVRSILAQSFSEFNLIVLDNNSTDQTIEWLKSLRENRIIIYPSQTDLTMEENWGRIVSIPKNEFITIIGHDDILDKNYLEVMNQLIQNHPQASLYQTHFRFIDSGGKLIRKCRPMKEKQNVDEFLDELLSDNIDTMGTGYMMRSDDYDKIGGIQPFPNLLFADHELWLKLTGINYKATAANECFSFRLHQSVSKMSDPVKYSTAFFRFLEYLTLLKKRNKRTSDIIERKIINYIDYYCQSLSHRFLKTPTRKRGKGLIKNFMQQCKKYADILLPGNKYDPSQQFNMRITKLIDSNSFLRALYLFFRKVYKKPIYK